MKDISIYSYNDTLWHHYENKVSPDVQMERRPRYTKWKRQVAAWNVKHDSLWVKKKKKDPPPSTHTQFLKGHHFLINRLPLRIRTKCVGFYFSLSSSFYCLNFLWWALLVLCHLKQKVTLMFKDQKTGKCGVPARRPGEVRHLERRKLNGALDASEWRVIVMFSEVRGGQGVSSWQWT